ncbi:DUF1214 domain-containing protein [Nocardioides zeae]|uniref:DUF1214 domain-containing protein n=1 Tax=Nocardioides imazamoxiresistens TaxID=3231893 RepID=A0ABU3PUC2_9ACTN|nr:DUF1214 domain-containing protein [Nocardioides zeae]MDT9592796.1 DUF1214 domain-containing protein [Nocardioides zeae]
MALADTGSPWSLGQRTHGAQLPPLTLRRGPLGLQERGGRLEISTPHRFLMICGRTLVEPGDADDLRRVHALQDEVRVRVLAGARAARFDPEGLRDVDLDTCSRADEVREPDGFAPSLARVLRDLDPDAVPAQVRDDLGTCGIAGDAPHVPTDLAPAVREGLADGVRRIEGRVGALGRLQNGWALNERGPAVGDDLLLRAAVAMAQIYVNPVEEATYPVAEVDERGEPLDGAQHSYTVSFAADDPPPAQAFWSLTVYHRAGLLVENPLGRHAVGDRTPGLRRESDGSLRVEVSADPPPGGVANWLPAPRGPFRLMLRLYHPTDVAWSPPPVVRAGSGPAR